MAFVDGGKQNLSFFLSLSFPFFLPSPFRPFCEILPFPGLSSWQEDLTAEGEQREKRGRGEFVSEDEGEEET